MSQPIPFRYHMHPLDLCTRRWHIKIRRHHPQITDWLFHLTTLAQNARAKGRILIGGASAEAEDIALAWNPNASDEEVQEWGEILDALVEAEVLTQEEQGWSIARPSDWYRPPSREPHAEAERKKKARAPKSSARKPQVSADCPQVSAVCPPESDLSAPNQNQNQNQNQYPYPALPPNPAAEPRPESGSGRVDEPAETAAEIVQNHLPGVLSPQESQALAKLMTAKAPSSRKLEALRQACAEVAYEAGLAGNRIRYPRRVAIERAIIAVARAPNDAPDHWANPPQLPEYARIAAERSPVL